MSPGSGEGISTALDRAVAEAAFYRSLAEDFDHGSVVFDDVGTVRYASPVVQEFLGRTLDELVGTNIVDHLDPDEVPHALEALAWAMEHPGVKRHPVQLHFTREGHRRLVEVTSRVLRFDPRVRGHVVYVRDVTHEANLDHILDSVMRGEPVDVTLGMIAALASSKLGRGVVLTPAGHALDRSEIRAVGVGDRIVSSFEGEAVGMPWTEAVATDQLRAATIAELPPALRSAAEAEGLGGCWSAPVHATDGTVLGCITVWTRDEGTVSPARRAFVARLSRLAGFALERWYRDRAAERATRHDPVTGLANRIELAGAIERARVDAPAGSRRAVLLVELDGVAGLADSHGGDAATEALRRAAEQVRRVLRGDDLVARVPGERFAVLCAEVADERVAHEVARRIVDGLTRPVVIGDTTVVFGIRVGMAFDDGTYRDPLTVLADAEEALVGDGTGDDGHGCRRVAAADRSSSARTEPVEPADPAPSIR